MPADLPPEVAEAYARVRPGRIHLHALEIAHPGLGAPIRVVTGTDEDVSLPPAVGQPAVLWQACAFGVVLPDAALKEGVGDGQLRLDGVSAALRPHIEDLASTGAPATVDYYEYVPVVTAGVADFGAVTGPLQVYRGLLVRNVQLSAVTATAAIGPRDWGFLNLPRLTFDRTLYPALHG